MHCDFSFMCAIEIYLLNYFGHIFERFMLLYPIWHMACSAGVCFTEDLIIYFTRQWVVTSRVAASRIVQRESMHLQVLR